MMKIYNCILTTHDFLSFSSFDVAKITITAKLIHNYALTYAIHYKTSVLDISKKPSYERDLSQMTKFPTPAKIIEDKSLVKQTYNVIDEVTQKTRTKKGETYYSPNFGFYYKLPPGTTFQFYLVSLDNQVPRRIIRLGKKDCLCTIDCSELSIIDVKSNSEKAIKMSHPINPVDLEGTIHSYEKIDFIPPSPIVSGSSIIGPYIVARDAQNKKHYIAITKWIKDAANS
ncbi:MAG: type I-D CRISPR-associated protein Cas5/Csc1 [Promethearchaeota archaeon]